MLKQKEVSATRQRNGSYECAAMVLGYRVAKVYYGHTKREAIRLFVAEVNATIAKAR